MTFCKKLYETKDKGSTSLTGWKIYPKGVCVCVCILKVAAAGTAVHVYLKVVMVQDVTLGLVCKA